VERRRAGRNYDALFQLPLHDAHPWEHELAHAAHEQVEHPQEEHFAAHWQLPEAQPQPSEQEQAIVREEEYGEGGPRGKEWGSGTSIIIGQTDAPGTAGFFPLGVTVTALPISASTIHDA
jgi:hypothetical protein